MGRFCFYIESFPGEIHRRTYPDEQLSFTNCGSYPFVTGMLDRATLPAQRRPLREPARSSKISDRLT
jgi:hypothetical protein